MAAPIHVKAKGKWKTIEIPSNAFTEEGFDNIIALEELHDYEILRGFSNNQVETVSEGTEKTSDVITATKKQKLTYKQQKKLRDKEKRKRKKKLKKDEIENVHTQKTPAKPVMESSEHIPEAGKFNGSKKRKLHDDNPKPAKKKQKKSKSHNYSGNIVTKLEDLPPLHKYPPGMEAWKHLFVPKPVLWALKDEEFLSPTSIQALTIPHAIRDRLDILGAAETGSGKTLAFSIPILHHVIQLTQSEEADMSQPIKLLKTHSHKMLKSPSKPETKNFKSKKGSIDVDCVNDGICDDNDSDEISEDDDEHVDNDDENGEISEDDDEHVDNDDENDTESINLNTLLSGKSVVFDTNENDDLESVDLNDLLEKSIDVDSGVDNGSDGELYDDPPNDEDYDESEENEFGCVKIVHNIVLDTVSTDIKADKPIIGLILEPTRELAIQVKNHLQKAAKYVNVRIATVVGGMAPQKQRRILSKCPEIIIATPGRLWELLQEGDPHLIKLPSVKVLVVDEADRMVEKGHFEELTKLFELMKEDTEARLKRQTLVFSATLTMMHQGTTRRFKKKKKKQKILLSDEKLDLLMCQIGIKQKKKVVDLTTKTGTAETLTEARINCPKDEKDLYLYYFRRQYPGRTLVFANSKDCLRRLVSIFTELGCKPCSLHADMHQKQRLKNLEKFSATTNGFLLASDVAARGLDIPNVQHVIHYQVPRTIENYVHRSGRTARASKEGLSVMLISQDDVKNYRKIVHSLNRDEELPVFPIEYQYIPVLKAQLRQALEIDTLNHRFMKVKRQNDWFVKAAEEMEIDIKDEKLLVDIGDNEKQRQHSLKLDQLRAVLLHNIKQPLAPRTFSGKYPTKMGKLVMPQTSDNTDAITKMKKDKHIQRPMIQKIARNPKIKPTKVKKQKEKKKNKHKLKNVSKK